MGEQHTIECNREADFSHSQGPCSCESDSTGFIEGFLGASPTSNERIYVRSTAHRGDEEEQSAWAPQKCSMMREERNASCSVLALTTPCSIQDSICAMLSAKLVKQSEHCRHCRTGVENTRMGLTHESVLLKMPRERGIHMVQVADGARGLHIAAIAIIGLALTLRIWNLGSQSIWGDDYCCIGFLNAASWGEFRQAMRPYSPDMPPLYFTIVFWWAHLFGSSPFVVRLLSVIFSVLAAPLVFLTARRLVKPPMSLLPLLLFSLSPLQIFHSQDMRGYSLTVFLGLLSAYSFLRMLENGGFRWWTINAAANILLVWVHLVGVLLPIAWGIGVVLWLRRRIRMALVWGVVQIAAVLPLLGLVRTVIEMAEGAKNPLPIPFASALVYKLLGSLSQDGAYLTWAAPLPYHIEDGLVESYFPFSLVDIFNLCISICMLILLCRLSLGLLSHRSCRMTADRQMSVRSSHGQASVFLLFFAPFFILFITSWLLDPDRMQLRYLLFSSPALYLFAAIGLEYMHGRYARQIIAVSLILAFLGLSVVNVFLPVRGDYRGAAALIAQKDPDRPILVYGNYNLTSKLLLINVHAALPNMLPLSDIQSLSQSLSSSAIQDGRLWFVFEDTHVPGAADARRTAEHVLNDQGFSFRDTILAASRS